MTYFENTGFLTLNSLFDTIQGWPDGSAVSWDFKKKAAVADDEVPEGVVVAVEDEGGVPVVAPWRSREITGDNFDHPWLIVQGLEHIANRFTGKLIKPVCHGKGKLHWALRFCQEKGIGLDRCYFYTDSIRDLPVLEAVGHPIPVNPDVLLRREARNRGWPIEYFRTTLNNGTKN